MTDLPLRDLPLRDLPIGQSARVSRVTGEPGHVHWLREFGLLSGTRVEMFCRGNPCILRIAGNKVCLRVNKLLHVRVELDM